MSQKLKIVLLRILLFAVFLFYYSHIYKSLPALYHDEAFWIGTSYFFDLLVRGDRENPLWQSVYSYDQPKFVQYVSGAVLYPSFIFQKKSTPDTYLQFLSDNHLLCSECISSEYLAHGDIRTINYEQFQQRIETPEFQRTRTLIYTVRFFNVIVTSMTVVVVSLIGRRLWDTYPGLLLALLYGFNSLIIRTSLVAHADAIFLFLFTLSLAVLQVFAGKRNLPYAGAYGLFVGLTASAKIVGSLLLLIFFAFQTLILLRQREWVNLCKSILEASIVLISSLLVFILINPYLRTNTLSRIHTMYAYRVMMTEQGSLEDPENSLKYPLARGLSVFKRFFSIDSNTYSTPVFMEGHKGILNYIYPVLFLCGFLSFLRKFVRSRGKAILMLIFPLAYIVVFVTMLSWMKVGWHRYYTLVSLSVLIMQVEGIMNVYHMIQNMSTNVINTLRSN